MYQKKSLKIFVIFSKNNFTQKNILQVISVFSVIFLLYVPFSSAFALPFITFDKSEYKLSDYPNTITIDDSSNPLYTDIGSGIQKIDAILLSNEEQKTITLVETGDTTGIFTTNFALAEGVYEFHIGDTIQINHQHTDYGETTNNIVDTENCFVGTTDPFIFSPKEVIDPLTLTETGPNTGQFSQTITLVNNSTSNDKIKVDPGDLLFIQFDPENRIGIVMPNPIDGFSMIKSSIPNLNLPFNDILRVSYGGATATAIVKEPGNGGGGGGGGPIHRPGLVLNFLGTLLGGSSQFAPPTLGLDENQKRIVDDGFSFNGIPVDVLQYYTPYPLITTPVGQNNTIKLKIYEENGPRNIAHIGLSYGLGKGQIFNQGQATIEYDKTFDGIESITLFDPNHVLGPVNVTSTITQCSFHNNAQCLEVTFDHMFREPLEYNMIATNIWDFERNGWQNYFNHGVQIVGESMNPPAEYSGIYKGHIYHLTETGKNTAIDDDGNNWTFDKIWNRDYIKPSKRG